MLFRSLLLQKQFQLDKEFESAKWASQEAKRHLRRERAAATVRDYLDGVGDKIEFKNWPLELSDEYDEAWIVIELENK